MLHVRTSQLIIAGDGTAFKEIFPQGMAMENIRCGFTFMHLADAFIQSDLVHLGYTFLLSVCVFPGN